MNRHLRRLVDVHGGVVARADVLSTVPSHVLDHALRARRLVRLYPGVYVDPARAGDPTVAARAALRYAGPDAALSHVTALAVWRLPGGSRRPPVHVLVPAGRRCRAGPGLVAHRRAGFRAQGPAVVTRSGLPVCRVEPSVVDSWALLPADTRRELLRLLSLLARGCRSELELWGYEHVFTGADLPPMRRNVPVRVGGRTVYLDVYCPDARVNFELDGAKFHTSARDRERDARRDAALAALGIMAVRFTHDQLVGSPELVRGQIRAILAARIGRSAALDALPHGDAVNMR